MTFKQAIILLSLCFVVVLAAVVARQMSTEAMAVVIGIVCGVLSGIPTSVLLLVALNRRDSSRADLMRRQTAQPNFPPVVVVQGGMPQGFPHMLQQGGYWPAPVPGPATNRHFNIVGGDELLVERDDYWQG